MLNIYNEFSIEYNDLFVNGIKEFVENYKKIRSDNRDYTCFYPSFGVKKNEPCDFLIVGQAAGGWVSGFNIFDEIDDNELISEAVECSNRSLKKYNHSPLDWVNIKWTKSLFRKHLEDQDKKNFYEGSKQYEAYKSFFWNVTFKLLCDYYSDLDRDCWEWTKRMVWSNLYKVAPDGSNPNEIEKKMQEETSIKLLKKELDELKPKYCIVLTNKSWWLPFQEKLGFKNLSIPANLSEIEIINKYNNTLILVTTRPRVGAGEIHVKQILELVKSQCPNAPTFPAICSS